MTPAQELDEYMHWHNLTCRKCQITAHLILRFLGLERAINFVRRQRPH